MGTSIVKEGSLNLPVVAKVIEKSKSFGQLLRKWRLFGEELGLKDEKLMDLQVKLNIEIYSLSDLPREILTLWKRHHGTKATLEILCNALNNCGVHDISNALYLEFRKLGYKRPLLHDGQDKVHTWGRPCQSVKLKRGYQNVTGTVLRNEWKTKREKNGVFQKPFDTLDNCGVVGIDGDLGPKFAKMGIEGSFFLLNDRLYTLMQLLGDDAPEELYEEIYEKYSCVDEPLPLLKEEVSPKRRPDYYISRNFSSLAELDDQIFRNDLTKDHVFVVKGASKVELAQTAGLQMIDSSGNQLKKITAGIIILDVEDDFKTIRKISTMPVHMIIFRNNRFFWVKSTSRFDTIQLFLKKRSNSSLMHEPTKSFKDAEESEDTSKDVNSIKLYEDDECEDTSEDDLCEDSSDTDESDEGFYSSGEEEAAKLITSRHSSSVVTITESPGMGKTYVLNSLAATIGERKPNAVTIFIVLQEFVRHVKSICLNASYLDCVLQYATTDLTKKSILQQMWHGNLFQLYLFLDGYDEVFQEKLDFVDSILDHLAKIRNVTVVVTSRKHLKPRLENAFNSLQLEMQPFTESNKVDFLTKYWSTQIGTGEGKNLNEFARACLNKLNAVMSDSERNIAGIPLQCMMLAEVCAADAIRASNEEQIPEDAVKIFSFFQMYKALIDLKLSKISDPATRQKYLDAHVYNSISLLFPEWLEKFDPYLNQRYDIDEDTLYSIGLLEKTSSSMAPRFVHRTFAEYMLAGFLCRKLQKSTNFLNFLLNQIFGEMHLTSGQGTDYKDDKSGSILRPSLCGLKHPVMAYFLNMHLQDRFCNADFPEFLNTVDLQYMTEKVDDVYCLDLTTSITQHLRICYKVELIDENLLHSYSLQSNNNSLFQADLILYRAIRGLKYEEDTLENDMYYNLQCAKQALRQLQFHLMRANWDGVLYLFEKLSIIEDPIRLNRKWREGNFKGKTTLPQADAYANILKLLGASIIAHSIQCGTDHRTMVLCNNCNYEHKFSDMLWWVCSKGVSLARESRKNYKSAAPVMVVIEWNDRAHDELIRLIHEASADFIDAGSKRDSIIVSVISVLKHVPFDPNFCNFGANQNQKNNSGMNATEVDIQWPYEPNSTLGLVLIELQTAREIYGYKQNDGHHSIIEPIRYGALNDKFVHERESIYTSQIGIVLDEELKQFLYEENFNLQYKSNDLVSLNAVWLRGLQCFFDMDSVSTILEYGFNANHHNIAENATDYFMKYNQSNSKQASKLLKSLISRGFKGLNQNDTYGRTRFMTEIMIGNSFRGEFFQILEDAGVDFNAKDKRGNSVLFYAIEYSRDLHFINKLLEFGANPNHKNYFRNNAAHFVINCNHDKNLTISLFKTLASHGFNGIDQKNNDGCTPIMKAIEDVGIIQGKILMFLHENGVDFNAQDCEGNSVLFYSITYTKSLNFVSKILDLGADPNHKNLDGQSAADIIIQSCWNDPTTMLNLLKLLVWKGYSGFNPSISSAEDFNRITLALQNEEDMMDAEVLTLFFEAASNVVDENGDTILFHALRHSVNVELIRIIIDIGANVNHRNNGGENAAHLLFQNCQNDPNFAEKLKLLQAACFDGLNQTDYDGFTPIMTGIKNGNIMNSDVLKILKTAGVNFDARGKNGDSVLFYAIKHTKSLHFIRSLLDFGVDPNHKNNYGSNAAHLILRRHLDDPIFTVNLLELLKSKGFIGFDEEDNDGYTPIMKVVVSGEILEDEILEFCLKSGADLNAGNDIHENSILFSAIANSRNLRFIQKILDLGGNPNHTNENGHNPAHFMFQTYYFYRNNPNLALEVLKMLEAAGFHGYNQRDIFGNTPLKMAINNKIKYKPLLKFLHQRTDKRCSM